MLVKEPEQVSTHISTHVSTQTHSNHDMSHEGEFREEEVIPPDDVKEVKGKFTSLPKKKVTIVFIMFLCDTMSFSSLMTYVAYMVKDFKISGDERVLGYFVGLLSASYFIAQFISSFFWGYLSDRIGRRPVLLFGLFGSCLSVLIFGFSWNIWVAILSRSLYGLLNGNIGVFKTYLGEITDATNQTKAFSILAFTIGIGGIVGPMIGGYLSRPVDQYPILSNTFFPEIMINILKIFPYLLPNLIIFLCGLISLLLAIFFLDESNVTILERRTMAMQDSEIYNSLGEAQSKDELNLELQDIAQYPDGEIRHDAKSDGQEQAHNEQVIPSDVENHVVISEKKIDIHGNDHIPESAEKVLFLWKQNELCTELSPLVTASLYSLTGFAQIIFDEGNYSLGLFSLHFIIHMASIVMPLFALLPVYQGGLQFTTAHIGTLGVCIGITVLLVQLFLISRILQKFGCLAVFRVGTIVMMVILPLFPEIGRLASLQGVVFSVLTWTALIIFIFLRTFCVVCTFTSIMILQNNSVLPKNMGKLNGFGQTGVAAGRAIGPVLSGSLFAWSNLNNLPFPLDNHLVFFIASGIFLFIFLISLILPHSLNAPKKSNLCPEQS